ncbi:sulfurtransferase [Mangrovicoccus algicola]|uniref:Sulfurtransferase n=1 Tax=Mangrovicoccus algicola TaxID=2771008 RepID=A0A8J6YTP3_9RHOB|nr:rhodanese-like domain-containing protein [Mangrovicoccus algicola]MBE3637327.1 sulfurtransferase [Mangrovicoccus algicola]
MRHAFLALAALAGLAAGPLSAEPLGPLVTPAGLDAALQQAEPPVVLDIRGGAYEQGHVAGAVSAPYALFRGPAENPGQRVPVEDLEATYESLGLDPARPVVIVPAGASDTDFGAAARVYWTLKSSGFTGLSILNGGAAAWERAGLPVSDAPVTPAPTELSVTWDERWTAETAEVADAVQGGHRALLLDARPAAFYEGEQAHDAAARPGTLPGARNFAYTNFFHDGETAISPVTDLDGLKSALGLGQDAPEEIVSFCNTGHWAATNWFALSELAGLPDVKLYPGSMVEYSATDGEMQNVPGLWQTLKKQFGAQ